MQRMLPAAQAKMMIKVIDLGPVVHPGHTVSGGDSIHQVPFCAEGCSRRVPRRGAAFKYAQVCGRGGISLALVAGGCVPK